MNLFLVELGILKKLEVRVNVEKMNELVDQFVNAVVPVLNPMTAAGAIDPLKALATKVVGWAGDAVLGEMKASTILEMVLVITKKGFDERITEVSGTDHEQPLSSHLGQIFAQAEISMSMLLSGIAEQALAENWSEKKQGLILLAMLTAQKCGYDNDIMLRRLESAEITTVWDAICVCPFIFLV